MPHPDTTAVPPPDTLRRLLLIDGSGYIFRSFYALPLMTRSDGFPVGAVLGFCRMILNTLEGLEPDHGCIVVFDAARRTFRNDIYPAYKANRQEPPEALARQFPIVKTIPPLFGLASTEQFGFEADDLIASYARLAHQASIPVTIISSDKDLMQLVKDGVSMYDPVKNRTVGKEQVQEKFGVEPDRVIDVQALAGDSSDNIPGVPGIGPKTAAELIQRFGDLENLLAHAKDITQPKRRQSLIDHADDARMSLRLCHLRDDIPVAVNWADFKPNIPEKKPLLDFLHEFELRRITQDVQQRFFATSAAHGTTVGKDAPRHYVRIDNVADLAAWLEKARQRGRMAFATQTDGIDPLYARLIGVSMACEDGHACYVPFGHVPPHAENDTHNNDDPLDDTKSNPNPMPPTMPPNPIAPPIAQSGMLPLDTLPLDTPGLDTADAPPQISLGQISPGQIPLGQIPPKLKGQLDGQLAPGQIPLAKGLALLQPILEDPSILKISHNIKFNHHVLHQHGINISPVEDTQLLSWCSSSGARGHHLQDIAQRHLQRAMIPFTDIVGSGKKQKAFAQVPISSAVEYAAENADITWQAWSILTRHLIENAQVSVYEMMERPLLRILAAMEQTGICLDRHVLLSLSRDFAERMALLEKEIHRLAGREFTIGSPKQLSEILYQEMGLRYGRKGKSGVPSTRAGMLEELAAEGHELPRKVLAWRHLAKLQSTYTSSLIKQAHPDTRRVHTSFSMTATSTGRLASSDPNLQNIPIRSKDGLAIRAAFIAEKGWTLLSADYSQIELRLLAHVASIDSLKKAFAQGMDIHAVTAAGMFGGTPDSIDPTVRRQAKAINFGIIYGISPFGLARQLDISRSQAKTYIETFMQTYPGIRDYMERTIAFCRQHGYVETPFGRRCYMPQIHSSSPQQSSFAERAAINAPLQGGAADLIKRAMIRIDHALHERKRKSRMLLQVHDELIFEVPEGEKEEMHELVGGIMRDAGAPLCHFDPPLIVNIAMAENWRDAH